MVTLGDGVLLSIGSPQAGSAPVMELQGMAGLCRGSSQAFLKPTKQIQRKDRDREIFLSQIRERVKAQDQIAEAILFVNYCQRPLGAAQDRPGRRQGV